MPNVKPPIPAGMDLFHISFYKFVALSDAAMTTSVVRALAEQHELQGLIDVAFEGISAAVAGTAKNLDSFELALTNDARLGGCFAGTVFKRTACKSKPFHSLKVSHAAELIKIGLDDETNKTVDATKPHGIRLSPKEWRELIAEDDVVLIDNRNSFEFELGRFKGAIDPKVAHYRDFPKYIEDNLPVWKAEGKRVAMYCTGGIRCEKTAAWMDTLDTTIYQLEGGIISYLAQTKDLPDAQQDWQGECFVFDNRIALDAKLQETDTNIDDVYDEARDGKWRIERAKRLSGWATGPISTSEP
ncbi:MAG: rhodanese-like domain-containing protein [Cytophagales bacterium]|nr:rhodanese-like domain-containing protein [Cytophagales bacterium]